MSDEIPGFETPKDMVHWEIRTLVGVDAMKELVDDIDKRTRLLSRQGATVSEQREHTVILGNTGTGKTTTGQLFGQYMRLTSMVGSETYKEVTGSQLLRMGHKKVEKLFRPPPVNLAAPRPRLLAINNMSRKPDFDTRDPANFTLKRGCLHKGGVLFVDDVDQLVGPHAGRSGQLILHILQEAMDMLLGELLIIFAGCEEKVMALLEQNPGLRARIPHVVRLEDFTDFQMLGMLLDLIDERFEGKMAAEARLDGAYMHAAVMQLGRQRGQPGFSNAYAVRNLLDEMSTRQAKRLCAQQGQARVPPGKNPLFYFTRDDILGPNLGNAMMLW
ncbi:hypothetical protein A9Z42_0030130 [Trichoderma parareesei]|uniref:AAA+ ATPase domain-containing protein n=1 Tax=Trichoderma parareesei TaxID=858221 RepID=A0A2H2ZTH3_TRIPA|nr:hypothetical protein A9Z42_0030130 [Trichoderma parareesei]